MKKLLLIFLVLFIIVGCNKSKEEIIVDDNIIMDVPITQNNSDVFERNNFTNSIISGQIVENEDYYFYKNISDENESIYRYNKHTGENTKISDTGVYLSLYNNRLYFVGSRNNNPEWCLYSIDFNGNDLRLEIDNMEVNFQIVAPYIYYLGNWFAGLYRYNMDTGVTETITEYSSYYFAIVDNKAYIVGDDIFVVNVDTKVHLLIQPSGWNNYEDYTVPRGFSPYIAYSNGYVYYLGGYYDSLEEYNDNSISPYYKLTRIDIKSNETEYILSFKDFPEYFSYASNNGIGDVHTLLAYEDKVYFTYVSEYFDNKNKSYALYEYSNNGLEEIFNEYSDSYYHARLQVVKDNLLLFIVFNSTENSKIRVFDHDLNEVDYPFYQITQ